MKEYGRIGQKRWEGQFYEEFLPELSGMRGIKVFQEMKENDDTVGAILFAIKMLIRQVEWHVEPGGDSAKDKEAAEFVESCMDDMQATWTDTISEILSFLPYGWSFHEIVYKRRMGKTKNRRSSSKYSDGLIGWQKLPPRAQDTLYRWEYDDSDNLIGMTQQPPPDYGLFTIPMSKAMLFRTESVKDNPEGRSILRNAYRSWLLNVSQIISKKAPSATENNSVLSELSAKLPVFSCPSIIKSARTVWAIFVSYLFMIALVSNCLVPPVLRSSASYPCGRTSPSDSFLRRFFTMVISAPLILTMSGS